METPDISPLSQLSLGDHFHFAYRALRDERGKHVPQFQLTEVGKDFCGIQLMNSSGTMPGVPTRLLKTTLVRKIFMPKGESPATDQSPGSLIVETVVFSDGPMTPLSRSAGLLSEKRGLGGVRVS